MAGIENMTVRQLEKTGADGLPLLVHILRENPLPGDHELWGLRMQDGACLAHWAARYGVLPHDFRRWMLRDTDLKTVAHEALEHGLSRDNLRLDFPPWWVTWKGRSLDLMDIGTTPWSDDDPRLHRLIKHPQAMMDVMRQWPTLPPIVREAALRGKVEVTPRQWFEQNGFYPSVESRFYQSNGEMEWTAVRLAEGATSEQMQTDFPEVWEKFPRQRILRQASSLAGACPPGLIWRELDAQDKMSVLAGILEAASYASDKEKSFAMRQRAAKSIDWDDIDVLQPVTSSFRPLLRELVDAALLPGHDPDRMMQLRDLYQKMNPTLIESFDQAALCCGFMPPQCTAFHEKPDMEHTENLLMALKTGALPDDHPLGDELLRIHETFLHTHKVWSRHQKEPESVHYSLRSMLKHATDAMLQNLPSHLFDKGRLGMMCAKEIIRRGIDHPAIDEKYILKVNPENPAWFFDGNCKPVSFDVTALIASPPEDQARCNLIREIAKGGSFCLLPETMWVDDYEIIEIAAKHHDLSSMTDLDALWTKNWAAPWEKEWIQTSLLRSGNTPIHFILEDPSLESDPVRLSMLPLSDARVMAKMNPIKFFNTFSDPPLRLMDGAQTIDWSSMPHDKAVALAEWMRPLWFQWLDAQSGVYIHCDPDLAQARKDFLLSLLQDNDMVDMTIIDGMLDARFWRAKAPGQEGTMLDVLKKTSQSTVYLEVRNKAAELLDLIHQRDESDLRKVSNDLSRRLQSMDL